MSRCKRCGFNPWVWEIPWRRAWQPTPVFLPGKPHGQRSLVGSRVTKGQTQLEGLSSHPHTREDACSIRFNKCSFKTLGAKSCKKTMKRESEDRPLDIYCWCCLFFSSPNFLFNFPVSPYSFLPDIKFFFNVYIIHLGHFRPQRTVFKSSICLNKLFTI